MQGRHVLVRTLPSGEHGWQASERARCRQGLRVNVQARKRQAGAGLTPLLCGLLQRFAVRHDQSAQSAVARAGQNCKRGGGAGKWAGSAGKMGAPTAAGAGCQPRAAPRPAPCPASLLCAPPTRKLDVGAAAQGVLWDRDKRGGRGKGGGLDGRRGPPAACPLPAVQALEAFPRCRLLPCRPRCMQEGTLPLFAPIGWGSTFSPLESTMVSLARPGGQAGGGREGGARQLAQHGAPAWPLLSTATPGSPNHPQEHSKPRRRAPAGCAVPLGAPAAPVSTTVPPMRLPATPAGARQPRSPVSSQPSPARKACTAHQRERGQRGAGTMKARRGRRGEAAGASRQTRHPVSSQPAPARKACKGPATLPPKPSRCMHGAMHGLRNGACRPLLQNLMGRSARPRRRLGMHACQHRGPTLAVAPSSPK